MDETTCLLDGCDRADVRPVSGYCDPHHRRVLRNGTPGDVLVKAPRGSSAVPRPPCSVDGCDVVTFGRGMCKSHRRLALVNGDPTIRRPPGLPIGLAPIGDKTPTWLGGRAAYSSVHHRLRRAFGEAANLSCVDCTGPAEEWSYKYGAPDEAIGETGNSYSNDLSWYEPRCIPCHRRYDHRFRRQALDAG